MVIHSLLNVRVEGHQISHIKIDAQCKSNNDWFTVLCIVLDVFRYRDSSNTTRGEE